MVRKVLSQLSYSNVMATIAVFVAMGGGAYAAISIPRNSVGPKQIKKNGVGAAEIKTGAVRSAEVKNSSLLARDFKPGELPAGATGPAGGVLGGTYPDPGFAAGVNKLVPVAVLRMSKTGTIVSEAHRPPITGAPTVVQHTPTQGDFTINFPGFEYSAQDAAVCTLYGSLNGVEGLSGELRTGPNGTNLFIGTASSAGGVGTAADDKPFQCAVYDL